MRSACTLAAIALAAALVSGAQAQRRAHHPLQLFNGTDLEGWQGDASRWSVVDGILTGITDGGGQDSFLVYTGSSFEDFELSLKARVTGDNPPGIHYRSHRTDAEGRGVSGYRLGICQGSDLAGRLDDVGGRGLLAQGGSSVRVPADGRIQVLSRAAPPAAVDPSQWNDYSILASGSRLVHKVNGVVAAAAIDDDVARRSLGGLVALHLPAGTAMKLEVKEVVVRRLERVQPSTPPIPQRPTPLPTPEWIWSADPPQAGDIVYFRKLWIERQAVATATLSIACDGAFTAFLDGREIGSGGSAQPAYEFDLADQLATGSHTLAIRTTHRDGQTAGLIARLATTYPDGTASGQVSDRSWLAKASSEEPENWLSPGAPRLGWQPPQLLGKLGAAPWGDVFAVPEPAIAAAGAEPTALPGFKLDRLCQLPPGPQGSWVALASGGPGRLFASAQHGSLYQIDISTGATTARAQRLDLPIGHAHSLLWAFDSLYVCVNGPGIGGHGSGLYRLVDSDADGNLDTIHTIRRFAGSGERGPHGVVLGPDPVSLYVVGGDRTAIPDGLARSRPPRAVGDGALLSAPGEARAGGWICMTRPGGGEWVLHSVGHRNPYDLAFDYHGNLFTCDADSPSDLGLPGFRPTSIYHVPDGADLGFREGGENLPGGYPDTLPATLALAPGAPTGITFGYGAAFPARFQQALFVGDWARGRIDAVHLEPSGASYRATSERFVLGPGLRVTDLVVGADGALYFTTGGRDEPSALWRVTYSGDQPTTPFARQPFDPDIDAQHRLRQRLGQLQGLDDPRIVPDAWRHLRHPDRFVRHAARSVIEHFPPGLWLENFQSETDRQAILEAAVALARTGSREQFDPLLEKLASVPFAALTSSEKIALLRAHDLAFLRLGRPASAQRERLIAQLSPGFPSGDPALDLELCRTLAYLDAPGLIRSALPLMADPASALHHATLLTNVKDGWTPAAIANYLELLGKANARGDGGANFRSYLEKMPKPWEEPAKLE